MSAAPPTWTGHEPLPDAQTLLLEASAGTGKTWQIAHLVTRLVAEKGLPVERILVITFTNDAAAELRDRVRARLAVARDVLADEAPPSRDPLLAAWQTHPEKSLLRLRLAAAYSAFDLAPISTIHGFSQRMLAQLAFESGQEAGLTLLADVQPLLDEWVADELARLFAAADEAELALAAELGWTRSELGALARSVTGAVMPLVLPPCEAPVTPLDALRQWRLAVAEFTAWLDGPAGTAAFAAMQAEIAAKRGRLDGKAIGARHLTGYWPSLRGWLAAGGPRRQRTGTAQTAWPTAFTLATLNAAWRSSEPVAHFAAAPLFTAWSALVALQDRLWAQPRATAAVRARAHLEAELQRRGALTYDAMLSRLADRIAAEGRQGALALAIGRRYDAALVDEFQDTDSAQWTVLDAAFQAAHKPLLLIGDPKQAIYGFRGADVHVYMAAVASGGAALRRATMRQNWRSDPDYVRAMNVLWREGSDAFALGGADPPAFDYVAVTTPAAIAAVPLRVQPEPGSGVEPRVALEIRWFDAGVQPGARPGRIGQRDVGEDWAAELCAREACQLLETTRLALDDAEPRRLRAGDIAVLVRTGRQARKVQRALGRVGVTSVAAGRRSVFASPAVAWLLAWLDAVAAPGRDGFARTLATTPLVGWTLRELDDALRAADALAQTATPPAERDWTAWMTVIDQWANRWPLQGFVRVFESALDHAQAIERLLAGTDGERLATDLRHLAELCHAEERRTRLSPGGLAVWLRAQVQQAASQPSDEQALRLESDAAAVQIVTIHASKGLEYPVVLLPFAWAEAGGTSRGQAPVKFHGPHGAVCLEMAPPHSEARRVAQAAQDAEGLQEQRRLLYVALTRARHHTVAWLAPAGQTGGDPEDSAFAALALRPQPGEDAAPLPRLPATGKSSPPEAFDAAVAHWHARLTQLAAASDGCIAWHREPPLAEAPQRVQLPLEVPLQLAARVWPADRSMTTPWLVTSYSALAAGRTLEQAAPTGDWEPGQGAEAPASQLTAELEPPRPLPADDDSFAATPEPAQPTRAHAVALATLPGGTDVGQWAHALMEHLDFQTGGGKDAADLALLAPALAARAGLAYGPQHAPLLAALPAVLATPLHGGKTALPRGFSLQQLQPADRLDELQFDLSLAGGADWHLGRPCVQPEAIQTALALRLGDHAWDGLPWLRRVHDETQFPAMAGVLTGSIDLVLRDGGRYFIADYKTNKIVSQRNRQLCLRGHYGRDWLAWDMAGHGYHLQALFYTLALHRFLRERLAGYAYDTHVGGHLYLYLRGMEGPEAIQQSGEAYGVYTDRWPSDVVLALDAALAAAEGA